MALNSKRIEALKPRERPFQAADGEGLHLEVLPSGRKVWRLRYRLDGVQEKVTLGEYPNFSLADAREWKNECRKLIGRGISPMREKRQERRHARDEAQRRRSDDGTVEGFGRVWLDEVVPETVKDPRNIRRALEKDVFPAIGTKPLADVTAEDVLVITDRIKKRGAPQSALLTRNVLKRLFAYAIARNRVQANPALAVEGKYIASPKKRDRVLSMDEIGQLLQRLEKADIRRAYKLALRLLLLTMVRKSNVTEARWSEFDLDKALWEIPAERMKQDRPHVVPLSSQAIEVLRELKELSWGSEFVFPSNRYTKQSISRSTLNAAIRGLDLGAEGFVIHDFRRTASTHLHEAGYNSDVVEKALAHEQQGVRAVYNRAEYLDQRREMLQWWGDVVDAQSDEGPVVIGKFRSSKIRRHY